MNIVLTLILCAGSGFIGFHLNKVWGGSLITSMQEGIGQLKAENARLAIIQSVSRDSRGQFTSARKAKARVIREAVGLPETEALRG